MPSPQDSPARPATLDDVLAAQRETSALIQELLDTQAEVKIQNVNMPFWSLVGFLLKVMIAAIPATIAYAVFLLVSFAVVTAFVAASRAR